MKKGSKDSKKQAKDLKELERISQDLGHEIILLPSDRRVRVMAEKKFSEFKRTHNVKEGDDYILRLGELKRELQQMRLEGEVEQLTEALKKPPIEMPKPVDEVLAQRIFRLIS